MNPRIELVNALRSELLGPRNDDPHETLSQDPRGEYVTGILEPSMYTRSPLTFYSSIDFRLETDDQKNLDDDLTESEYDKISGIGDLDPRALPKSIGISFVISKGPERLSDILCTWARYFKKGNKWERTPSYLLLKKINISKENDFFKDGIRVSIRPRVLDDNSIFVAIYLVNNTELEDRLYCPVDALIFQPQIRIQKRGLYDFLKIRSELLDDEENATLSLVYKDRTPLARGHMCGAIWNDIDPELIWGLKDDITKSVNESPFKFIDELTLTEEDQNYFKDSIIRTEFLPMYSIEQVKYNPVEDIFFFPEYDADILSNIYREKDLIEILSPIVSNYKKWIDAKKNEIHQDEYNEISYKLMEYCEKSLKRISKGIKYLAENENSRLAFCFMNKVMDTQSIWKRSEPLKWRLFQLAFILQNIVGVSDKLDKEREICDILWFPTSGGKTEAYLGLMIYTLSLRRLNNENDVKGYGTGVISRYTLRMLTLQQYRRTLYAILAAELLRSRNWTPNEIEIKDNLWGTLRFSIGLWIGNSVTPNYLRDHKRFNRRNYKWEYFLGGIGKLQGSEKYEELGHRVIELNDSEPAQIITCPVCNSILSIPEKDTLPEGIYRIHWIVQGKKSLHFNSSISNANFSVLKNGIEIVELPNNNYYGIAIQFKSIGNFSAAHIDRWWKFDVKPSISTTISEAFSRASKPGYFLKKWGVHQESVDFEIHCPNVSCTLNQSSWSEKIMGKDGNELITEPLEPFRKGIDGESFSIPIPAYTVDEQVYHRSPSVIIATVDKFARLPYEPKIASIFGNVSKYDSVWGFFRDEIPPDIGNLEPGERIDVEQFDKPDLIIQDELHLIEGPLGSMVGLYETLIDSLSTLKVKDQIISPKYIASSATIQKAVQHATSVFSRKEVDIFPALGLSISDNFFSHSTERHPLDSSSPGRLYLGVCAPGRGAHTPTIRIWSSLLRTSYELGLKSDPNIPEVDNFNTIVGYFNAIKELAQVNTLYHVDIHDRLSQTGCDRSLQPPLELSSQMNSAAIPSTLKKIEQYPNNTVDAVLATSMFGTGIDVDRLGLMVVHGQPKTTANYIQATGRVGRKKGGLIITFYRSTRPRDLDHYEFFTGYHRSLHRFVEPITANPFSPRARERAFGPIIVGFLRNAHEINGIKIHKDWAFEESYSKTIRKSGSRIIKNRFNSKEIDIIKNVITQRSQNQPEIRKPDALKIIAELDEDLIKWKDTAILYPNLVYYESAMLRAPEYPVVLGDPQHKMYELEEVFENAPNSLREVEGGARFEV